MMSENARRLPVRFTVVDTLLGPVQEPSVPLDFSAHELTLEIDRFADRLVERYLEEHPEVLEGFDFAAIRPPWWMQ